QQCGVNIPPQKKAPWQPLSVLAFSGQPAEVSKGHQMRVTKAILTLQLLPRTPSPAGV
ncbi:hypothetical protein HGM15179_014983, partial [Zosterops borbonicus]